MKSGEKYAQIKHRFPGKSVQNSSVSEFRFFGDGFFYWTMHYFGLWTRNLPRSDGLNALNMHLFLTNMHPFISQDIN